MPPLSRPRQRKKPAPPSNTVLSLGRLRLSLPHNARTPSLSVLPGDPPRVQVTFANFSGDVVFEIVDPNGTPAADPKPGLPQRTPTKQKRRADRFTASPPTTSPSTVPPSPDPTAPASPPPLFPKQQHTLPRVTPQPVLQQQPLQRALSHPISQPSMSQSMLQPSMSQPMPQPPMSQAMPMSQPMPQPSMSQPMPQPPMSQPMPQPVLSQQMVPPSLSQPSLSQPSLSQPSLSQPSLSQPSLSQPSLPQPLSQPSLSQSLSQPSLSPSLSQPSPPASLSQPSLSQLLPATNPFPLSQLHNPSVFTAFGTQPALPQTQLPDSSPPLASQSAPNQLDRRDPFSTHNYMPLSPPSSEDEAPDEPVDPLIFAPHPAHVSPPRPNSAKRRSPPRADTLAVKEGKRVRFQTDPEIFSESPLSRAASPPPSVEHPARPSPWESVAIDGDPTATPAPRWGATWTRLNDDSLILLGGESESRGFFRDMAILDVSNLRWICNPKDTPAMPGAGRAWHSTTCVDASLFVFGGEAEKNGERSQTNDALMYDTTYFSWYPPALEGNAPSPRAGHCAALVPNTQNIVIYGGIHGNRWLNDLHLLEEMSTWSKVRVSSKSARPSARSYASLTAASGFLVLFGGNNKTRCFNDVHLLSRDDMSWTEPVIIGRAPKPRTGHCALVSKDGCSVIVYGGWDDQGVQRHFYSDVWELRIKSKTECQWACLFRGDNASKLPGPRAGAALCSAGKEKRIFLFGGWHMISYFNDVSELKLPFQVRQSLLAGKSS